MAKQTYDQWLAERAVDKQSVKGLKGVNTIAPELSTSNIKKLSKIPGTLTPIIQPAGDVYTTPGINPSDYDENLGQSILDSQAVLQNRAEQQSGVLKAFNAVISGVGSGLLTAIETAGYLSDVQNNVGQLADAEYIEDNFVSEAAKQAKKSLYEAMPIYEDVQSDGVLDQFTRFSTLRGMLDSAIGFAIPGGIVGKGVGVVGRAAANQVLRSKRLASWVTGVLNQGDNTIAKTLLKGTNPEKIREGVQSLVGGLITNYGEGKMMALELGEELENQYINVHSQKILAERYNNDSRFAQEAVEDARAQFEVDEDAKREIGKQQNNFMQNNTIFAITDAIGLHKLGLSTRSTREVVKQLTMNPLKNLGGVGGLMVQNTKEGIEEIGQNVFQMEAGFQARKGMGIGSEEDAALTGKSLGDRYLSYATSDKALLEGMMGFVSGGLQRQLTQGFYDVASGDPLGKKRRDAHNKRYEVQQALMAQYTEEKLKDMATADSFRAEFLQNNQESLSNLINETEFTKMAREAAEGGTVGRLETLIKDIINLSPDKAEEQGYSKNYKEQYQQRLKELSDVEAIYMQHDGFKARDILASNRVTHKILTNSKQRYEDTLVNGYTREDARKESSQLEQLNKVLEVSNITPEFENGQRLYTITLDNFAALKDTKNAADIIILPEYKNAFTSFEALVKINEAIVDNNKKYQYIINEVEPNFEEVVKAQTEAAEKLAGTINKKQTTDAEISLRQDLEKAATQEERDAVFAAFKKRYEDSSIATSIQEIVNKVVKEYAPVEIETTTTSSPESGTFIKDTPYSEFQKEFEQFLGPEFKEEALLSAESVSDDRGNVNSESINKILSDEEGFLSNYKTENAKKAAQNFLNGLKKYKDSKTLQTNSATITTSPTSTETLPGNDKSFEGDNKVYVSNSSNDPVINAEMQVVENDIFTANEIQSGLNQSDALENLGKKDKYDYETKRINAWRHIAYLFRNYITKVVDKKVIFKDAENVANRPELIRALNKIKAGDEIEFRVIDNPDQEVYYTDTDGKRIKTTWGNHEANVSKNKDNVSLFIPIEIYSNGELIGYIPAFDHFSPSRDLDFGVAQKELAKMRNLIYAKYASGDKTPITSKITGVSAGHLIKAVNNELIPTNAALASDEVKIAIVKNKRLVTMGGGSLTGTVLNNADNLKEGFTYAVVPLPNGKVAIPLQRNNLQNDQVVNMTTALSIFMKVFNKETLTETERSTIAFIQDDLKSITRVTSANEVERVNFNITTVEGIRNYLSLYTHIHRAAGPSFDLLGQLAGRSFDTKFKAISIEEFVEKQSSVTENLLTGRRFIKITLANSNEVAEAYKYFPAVDDKLAHLDIIKSKGHGSNRVNSRQSITGADASTEFLSMAGKAAVHFSQMIFTPSITLLENAASFKLRNLTNPHEVNSVVYSDYIKQNTSTNILGLNVGTEENPEYVYTQQRNYTFDNSFANPETEGPSASTTEVMTSDIPRSKAQEAQPVIIQQDELAIKDGLFNDVISFSIDSNGQANVNLEDTEILQGLFESQLGISIFNTNFIQISPARQALEISTMVELISKALLDSPNNKLTSKEWKAILDERIKTLNTTIRKQAEAAQSVATLNYIDAIVDPNARPHIEELVMKAFKERAGIKTAMEHNEALEGVDEIIEGVEGYSEKSRYVDSYTFQIDHRLTMSTKLKLALSTIPSGQIGIGNIPLSYPFDEIYDRSMAILTGTEPSYDVMAAKLQTQAHVFPWINPLLNHLANQDESVRNGFVVVMHKHYVNMLFLAWKKQRDGFKMKVWRSNSNAIERTIQEQWFKGLTQNTELVMINQYGKYQFTEKATQIAREIQGISIPIEKGSDLRQKEAMNSLLNRLGIYLSDLTMDEIISNGLYYNGSKHKYNSLFGVGGTIVTDLYGKILNARLELDQEEDDINIFSGGYMKALIKLEAKYTKMNLSNSHKTGDKTVNSYADTKQAFDRMAALKSDRKLLTTLSKLPFSKRSRMLRVLAQYDARADQFIYGEDGLLLLNNDANFNPAAAEAFDAMGLDYLSLDVIKEIASEYVVGLSLEELGDREHEGIKASFFFNNKTVKEDGSRRGKLFYLTMSNKTIMTAMETPLSKFVLDEDGNIPEGTIANMVETLVLPEVDRMLAFRKYTKDGSISGPLEHYDQGTQIFYMIPALNYIDELFEEVNGRRMLRKGLDNLDNLLPLIQQTIEEFINKSIDDQIAHWQTIGFGYNNKTKVFDFIDRDMVTYYQQSLPKKISATAVGETTTVSETESEDEYNQRLFRTMAFDYLSNYMYHNMNLFQLFATDPALYYTAKQSRLLAEQNYEEVVKAVFNNIGKRLAAESAPGLQGDFSSVGMNYTVAMAKDTKISSDILTIYQRMGLSDSEIKSYREITSTDGAEFTTLEEHLKIMFVFNKLTRSQFDLLMKKLNQQAEYPGDNKYDFSKKELDLILKGVNLIINKPVQVHNRLLPYGDNVDNTIESRLYIKSAATPLIPQLTRGLQLDAIRVRMESRNNPGAKIDRLAFASAVKVGIPVGAVEIFDTNGNVIAENLSKLPLVTVNRNGFRIQQEIPFKEDHETINDGTQQRELLFAGLLHHKDLAALNKEYLATYNSIFSRYHDELMKEVGYDKRTGKVDTKAVLDIVRKEAVSRNYSINNIIALGLDDQGKLKYPLWGLPADSSMESLLLSIVDNRIRKLKLPGISTILSPQEGYNTTNEKLKSWEDVSNTASIQDTLFTDDFTGTLLPMRPADPNNLNGEWLPAQILISSTLKTPFGKDVNVRDYAIEKDGKWFLDTNVIPKELLKGFAYRIPTSSQSSMGLVQIVGFLPESMKEMVVASRDFIAQMGYDFDVDKLYANLYQMAYNPLEKKFQRLEDFSDEAITNVASLEMNRRKFKITADMTTDVDFLEEEVIDEVIEAQAAIEARLNKRRNLARDFNKLLDIHIQVMAHPETNKLRVQTVSYGKLETLAEEFGKKKAGSVSFNPLSPLYQKTKYINATAGQQGVGVFSAALVFLASAQAANLGYVHNNEVGVNQFTVTINNHKSTGDLSSPATLDGSTTRLSIMSRFQNASVDDESLQVLSAININSNTFNALTAGAMLGFTEEELITIINQPVIIEYVKRLKTKQGAFSDYEANSEEVVLNEMINALLSNRGISITDLDQRSKYNKEILGSWGKVSIDSFKNLVGMERPEDSTEAANYDNAQYFALRTFQKLRDAGKDILKVQNAVNLSSKGIGKSFLESSKKYISIKNIAKYNPNVVNAEALIGDYQRDAEGNVISFIPNTIRGYVTKYVLEPALEIYKDTEGNPLFPYTKPAFINALDQVLAIQGKSDAMGQAYLKEAKQFFNGLKGYLYSTPEVLGISNPNAERRRLLIDKKYVGNEEREPGYNLSGRKYSLAGLLDLLASKNHPVMTNNKFLRRLQYTINQEGLPSMITYKATVAQSMEELSIYNDFTRLLMADAPITIQEQGETFTISSRELAIDLIKYSYLTGGVQGPSEFIRYIPIQFLINAGVGTKLNSVNFGDSVVYGNPTSGYMLQYIQHFPSKVAATFPVAGAMSDETLQYLSATEEYYTDSDNYLTQFTPSAKLASHFGDELPLVMKMDLGKGKYELFMYDIDFNTYQRIPTLKYKQISEYQGNNLGNTVAQSIFIHNQTANLKLTVKGTTKSGKGINKNSNLSEREAYLQKYFPGDTGYTLSALHLMLNDMLPGGASENAELRPIVKRLIDAMDKYGINPKISILSEQDMPKHPSGASVRGAFLPDGTIVIRKSLPTTSEMRPAAYFITTLVHEATHALLQHFVTDYVNNRPVPKDIAVALGKLEAMRNFSNIKAKLEEITDNEINHGVGTLNEFVAAITSSLQFREFIADSSNKKRLIDILLEIFSAIFGVQLNSNQDTLKFIDENVMAILDNLAVGGQTDVLTKGQTQVILGSVNRLEKYLSKNPSIEDASAYIQDFRMGLPFMDPDGMEYRNTLEDIAVLENYIENYANPVFVLQPKKIINVYWGQEESTTSTKILSNLAPRKFIWEGREYGSVEHAYQSNKSGSFDKATYDAYNNIKDYYNGNIEPEPNTIFVFGSNPEGRHGAGAAKVARDKFGAIYGQGEGLQGNAYALPTKDLRVKDNNSLKSIDEKTIISSIEKLYKVAEQNPKKQFKIAYRNTIDKSLNGYTGLEMIDMFNQAGDIPSNIVFSKEWIDTGKIKSNFGYGKKIKGKSVQQGFDNLKLIKELVVESFKQNSNSEAAKKLLQYDDFTHNTNEVIDQAFLEGLRLAKSALLKNKPSTASSKISFQESTSADYGDRTRKNAKADATIALAADFDSLGEKLTRRTVEKLNKKYIGISVSSKATSNDLKVDQKAVDFVVNELNEVNAKTLNIAGNGLYTMKDLGYTQEDLDVMVYSLLKAVVESPKLKTKIESVRTGGQTGFDEAGAKAAIKLGIPTIVLAPKGWKFRDISSKDISNEELFKARFETKPSLEDEMRGGQSVISFSLENAINEGKVVSLEDFNTEIQEQIRSMMEWQNKNC